MFTRFIKIQLVVFTIASVLGLSVMALGYMQLPTLLGLGRITVTLELPAGGGLYQYSNVTYRGMEVGKVTDVDLSPTGAKATLSLGTSPRIPADLVAEVHSVSAVGEQYVDLLPRTSSAPYLRDGSVIALRDTAIPQPVGPMLDRTNALLASVPRGSVSALLDETSKGFDDAGYDLGSLFDSASTLSKATRETSGEARSLIDDSGPLLDGAVRSADATRIWMRSLAGVTGQLVTDDPQIRTLLQKGPGAFDEVSALLDQVKPTLPVLLANLTSLGKVAVTYNPSLEQLLVLVPSFFAGLGALSHIANATGLPLGDFRVGLNDPPPCTTGFLPQSQWRSPADQTTVDTPDGLYCKLPQDSSILVRGLRNLPCMARPGKRAPTVQLCDSDKPFEPLALRQHALGPNALDPNLIAQGIPPDDRVTGERPLYAPAEGTPLPPGLAPPQSSGGSPATGSGVEPSDLPRVPEPPTGPAESSPSGVAPSAFDAGGPGGPSVRVTSYDPRSGRYLGADGAPRIQHDLGAVQATERWQDLVLPDRG